MNWLDYYLGPTGIPDRLRAANEIFNPIVGIEDAMLASERMMDPELTPWDRVGAFGDMATNVAGVVAPVAAVKAGGQSIDDAIRAAEEVLTGVSMSPGGLAAKDFAGDEAGAIRAWHGSPHDFDKFSMDKIGTGEGAQAYGHGLYFADERKVAEGYRDSVMAGGDPKHYAALAVKEMGGEASAIDMLSGSVARGKADPRVLDAIRDGSYKEVPPSRLYEVNIDANPEDFLDWDAPLSAQPEKVRAALDEYAYPETLASEAFDAMKREATAIAARSGADNYYREGGSAASNRLREAGIPGIRYLDQGSRQAGDGSRNYVVFDDNLVSIIKKYGIAGAAAMLGMSAQDLQAQAADQGYDDTERKNQLQNYLDGLGL